MSTPHLSTLKQELANLLAGLLASLIFLFCLGLVWVSTSTFSFRSITAPFLKSCRSRLEVGWPTYLKVSLGRYGQLYRCPQYICSEQRRRSTRL